MPRRLRRPLSRLRSVLSAQRSRKFRSGGDTAHPHQTTYLSYCRFAGATDEVDDTPNSILL
jgi:hypothetical protein